MRADHGGSSGLVYRTGAHGRFLFWFYVFMHLPMVRLCSSEKERRYALQPSESFIPFTRILLCAKVLVQSFRHEKTKPLQRRQHIHTAHSDYTPVISASGKTR